MSYILDALKKAERDRLREDPKELDDFASSNWDPYQQPAKSNAPRTIVLLLCILALVIGLVVYSGLLVRPQVPVQQPAVDSIQAAPAPQVIEKAANVKTPPVPPVSTAEPEALALPQLQISGHMYMAEGSASNRLFANGGSFRQGDKLESHWTLVAVGIDGIEISAGQRREFLPYR
jgi:hypothetical protein